MAEILGPKVKETASVRRGTRKKKEKNSLLRLSRRAEEDPQELNQNFHRTTNDMK